VNSNVLTISDAMLTLTVVFTIMVGRNVVVAAGGGCGAAGVARQAHSRPIGGVSWSHFDPHVLAACSDERVIRIFDTRQKKPVASFSHILLVY
jgi:WD40 repeat protein